MSLGVYIPTYNCGQYLADTIESVLEQSIPSIKIVIVDNCSNDNTKEVVLKYIDRGVQYIKHSSNIGSCSNHNYCIDIADTEYIKLLSADDVLLPGTLALQMNALINNPHCGIATCDYLVTDSKLNVKHKVKNLSGFMKGNEAILICASKVANLVGNPSSIMLRKNAVGSIRFNPDVKWYGDFRFYCEILGGSDLVNIDIEGLLYRRHDLTDSVLTCTPSIRLSEECRFIDEYSKEKLEPRLRLLKRYKFKYVAHVLTGVFDRVCA